MPAAKFRPVRPMTDHHAAGHVFAAVIADAFDDGRRAAVADGEPLAGQAVDEHFAGGRAVEQRVADDHVFLGIERRAGRRDDDDPPAGKPLAQVIVGVAGQLQRDAGREKRAEALARRAGERKFDRAVGQSLAAPALDDAIAEDRAHRAVDIADRQLPTASACPFRCSRRSSPKSSNPDGLCS